MNTRPRPGVGAWIRTKRHLMPLALALLLVAIAAPACLANDGSIGGAGGSAKLISNSDVRMESELVQVTMLKTYAIYRVDFNFVNSGVPQKVKLGFPFPKGEDGDHSDAAAFRAWQDGYRLAVVEEDGTDGIDPVTFFTHSVTFPTGKSTVTVQYLAGPSASVEQPPAGVVPPARFAGMTSHDAGYFYILHTGAGWKGNIRQSVLRFTATPEFNGWGIEQRIAATKVTQWTPSAYVANLKRYTKPASNVYQWTFTDYEPTKNHDIVLPYWMPNRDAFFQKLETVTASPDTVDDSAWAASSGGVSDSWVVRNSKNGVGSWVRVPVDDTGAVRQIRVLAGASTSPEAFQASSRPKLLAIEFSDGTTTQIALKDEPNLQLFPVSAKATWAKVTVLESYAGSKTPHDCYLSEIEFATTPLAATLAEPFSGAKPPSGSPSASTSPSASASPSLAAGGGGAGTSDGSVLLLGLAGLALAALVITLVVRSGKGGASATTGDVLDPEGDVRPPRKG